MLFTKNLKKDVRSNKQSLQQTQDQEESPAQADSHAGNWVLPRKTGRWYPAGLYSVISSLTGTLGDANKDSLVFFWLPITADTTIDEMMIQNNQTAGADSFRLGIYADDGNGNPGNLVWDSGQFNFVGAAAQVISCGQIISVPGVWLCYSMSTGTKQMLGSTQFGVGFMGATDPTNGRSSALISDPAGGHPPTNALPTTAPSVINLTQTNIPAIYIKEVITA